MRKLLVGLMVTLMAALVFSCVVMAQNQAAPAARQTQRPETKPWNLPEQPRTGPAPAAGPARPGLFFREEWKMPSGEPRASNPDPCCWPISNESVASPNLELKYYGAGKEIAMVGIPGSESNPVHTWSGLCPAACALTLRDKNNYVDLTRGKVRWVTKATGFHAVRPVIKLADGTALIGDFPDGATGDWKSSELYPSEIRWLSMDLDRATGYGNWIAKPDLTKVDEIGWVDEVAGSGHNGGGYVDVATIEVYGTPVSRSAVQSQLTK